MSRAYPSLLLIVLVSLSGCASLDEHSLQALERARALIHEDPNACLEQATIVLNEHPHHADARRLAALALEDLEKYHRAAREWAFIVDARPSAQRVLEAHRGIVRVSRWTLGDLPHIVRKPPRGEERSRILVAFAACDAILEADPLDWEARFTKACCMYRLGLYHRARPFATTLVQERPQSEGARYLLVLIKEQQIGIHERALETLADVIRSNDADFQRQASNHVIYLLEDSTLPESARNNLRGHLLRFARAGDEVPEEVAAWLERYEALAVEERRQLRRERLLAAVERDRQALNWDAAWTRLRESEELDTEVDALRRAVAIDWATELIENGEHALARERLTEARNLAEQLTPLLAHLPDNLRGDSEQLATRVTEAELTVGIATKLAEADKYIRLQRATPARQILDKLPENLPEALAIEARALTGEALALQGENAEALTILDSVELSEPRQRRVYGILLAEAQRADEARAVLEALPYGYLAADALTALLHALETQRSWDDLLARLLTVPRPLSGELRELRRRACTAQAKILLRRRLPDAALKLIFSHTEVDERGVAPIFPVFLESLIATEQLGDARDAVNGASPSVLSALSTELSTLVADRVAPHVAESERFGLLQHLRNSLPEEKAAQIYALWPRFGNYLPSPGSYIARYRATATTEHGKNLEPTYVEQILTWSAPGYSVSTANATAEEWTETDGVWVRSTQKGEMRIPVRIGPEDAPYPRIEYDIDGAAWIAELVESGNRVAVDTQEYHGCLRVRLTPKDGGDEAIFLDLAPLRGEVRRQVFGAGKLQFTRELIEFKTR
ncbi:MAG: hypothetical protein AAF581_10935 [Planctomycetota bacterium]